MFGVLTVDEITKQQTQIWTNGWVRNEASTSGLHSDETIM